MGDSERPSPGHGGRTNPTRRRMKALKSAFTAPGAALHERAPSDEPRDTRRLVFGSVGWRPADRRWRPSERSDGPCARVPTQDRSPGASASSPPRSKPDPSTVHLRVPPRGAGEVAADPGEERRRRPRTRPGAHRHRGREPSGARLRERTGVARAAGPARAGVVRGSIRAARAVPDRPGARFRAVTARSRFDPGGRRGASLTTCRTRAERRAAHAGSARAPATTRGPRRGVSSGPVGGRPPDPGWTRRREPSRMRPPARRSASSARRRSEPPALTSRGVDPDDGTERHPRATQRTDTSDRPSTGKPRGGEPIPITPPAEVERFERGSDDRGEHGASARQGEAA